MKVCESYFLNDYTCQLTTYCCFSDEADRWELSRTCIEWGEEIGCGAFGSVFKCLLHKEKSDCCTTVAVKVLTGSVVSPQFCMTC